MERHTIAMVRSGVLAVVISMLLYRIAASSTLFIVPLLFFAPRFRPSYWALIPVGLVGLLLVGTQVVGLGGFLRDVSVFGALLVGFYLPVSMLVGTGIWIVLDTKRLLVRLLGAASFATVFGIGLLLWLSGESESARATAAVFSEMIGYVVPSFFGGSMPLGMTPESLFETVVTFARLGFLPLFLGQFGFSAFVSELLIHRSAWTYQDRMTRWQVPEYVLWVFLGSWTVVLATLLVDMPLMESLAWNVALSSSLLYMVQGMSILASLVRTRNPGAPATRIFLLAFLLVLLPGVNVIPVIGLPILGVSETWVRYRKFA